MHEDFKRITAGQVAAVRAKLAAQQGGRCAICKGVLGSRPPLDPVLDHDHRTGAVRGVLHRGCNSLLGHTENNAPRYGVADRLVQFCAGLATYIQKHDDNITGLIHYTYKTEDEKRLLRNKRARVARAKAKTTKES